MLWVDSAQNSRGGRLADTPAVCCLIFTPSPRALRAGVGDSPCHRAMEEQLRRRSDSVECRALRRFGRGACPEIPQHWGVWARPETPHSATTYNLTGSTPIKRESKKIDRAYSPTGAAMLSTASANLASRVIVAGDTLDSPSLRPCGGRSLSVKLII